MRAKRVSIENFRNPTSCSTIRCLGLFLLDFEFLKKLFSDHRYHVMVATGKYNRLRQIATMIGLSSYESNREIGETL